MGILDKFKTFIGYPDAGYYDEEEEHGEEAAESQGYGGRVEEFPIQANRSNKVVNIDATAQLQVVLVKPERFNEASEIADYLNNKNTVVLNLEQANKDESRRLLDFLSGVAYANDGQLKKVAVSTYLITPRNVKFEGGLLDELENKGVFF